MNAVLRENWLTRLWRGDYPFAQIFWGGLTAVIVVIWALNSTLTELSKLTQHIDFAYQTMAMVLVFYGTTTSISVFWLVGVWRSSRKAEQKKPNSSWPLLARMFVCVFGLVQVYAAVTGLQSQLADAYLDVLGDPQQGARGVETNGDGREILVRGFITRSVTTALHDALVAHPQASLVIFDSQGGRVDAARSMREIIRRMHLDTLVSKQCASACIIAFLGGHRRMITSTARLGFHAPQSAGDDSSMVGKELQLEAIAMGVSAGFAEKAYANSVIWYPSAQELKAAGVVTSIVAAE